MQHFLTSTHSALFKRLFDLSGWSQTECAEKIFKSPSAISRFLSGETEPTSATLELMRQAVLRQEQLRRQAAGLPLDETLLPTFPTELERYQKGYPPPAERVDLLQDAPVSGHYGDKIDRLRPDLAEAVKRLVDALSGVSSVAVASDALVAQAAQDILHGAGSGRPPAPGGPPAHGIAPESKTRPASGSGPAAVEDILRSSPEKHPDVAGKKTTLTRKFKPKGKP